MRFSLQDMDEECETCVVVERKSIQLRRRFTGFLFNIEEGSWLTVRGERNFRRTLGSQDTRRAERRAERERWLKPKKEKAYAMESIEWNERMERMKTEGERCRDYTRRRGIKGRREPVSDGIHFSSSSWKSCGDWLSLPLIFLQGHHLICLLTVSSFFPIQTR